MKVLVVHNSYSSRMPSGENVSVRSEVAWLREAGVDVHLHEATNEDLLEGGVKVRMRTGVETVWSRTARRTFERALDAFQPDLVHVHNLFPLLSASVPWAATRRGLPVLWTVRNRRTTCVKGGHFRADAPCHACRPGWRVPGVRYGCYNDSRPASALLTGATSTFRTVARRRVTALAISEHMRDWLVDEAGFPAARVAVKYNGVSRPAIDAEPAAAAASRSVVFVGKLTEHKGVRLLLDAWQQVDAADAELRFVGDGPLAGEVAAAADRDHRIRWVGQVTPDDVEFELAAARTMVVPSTWEEPFGRSAAEALALARPVVTTGQGGLSEIVDAGCGWITGLDPRAMAGALTDALRSDSGIEQRSRNAVSRYERLFSPEATTRSLMDVYEQALGGDDRARVRR